MGIETLDRHRDDAARRLATLATEAEALLRANAAAALLDAEIDTALDILIASIDETLLMFS